MHSPIRILHVEDNPFDRDLVRHALEKEQDGFVLTQAITQTEFTARLAEGDYDLVLSDFNILGFEGLQAIEAVHAKDPQMPVVVVTGTGSEETAVIALKRGAADYVIKTPEHIRRLPQTIRAVLEKKQVEESARQRAKELVTVYEAARKLQHLYTPQTLAREIIGVLENVLHYTFCAVLLIEEATGKLVPFAISTIQQEPEHYEKDVAYILAHEPRLGRGVTGWVAQHGETARLGNVQADARYYGIRQDILSELCVPLRAADQIIGVVNVESVRPDAFTEFDQRVLETVASQIAIAIQNSQLLDDLRAANTQLQSLSRQLVDIQENERRELAHEMHDQIGQTVTALGLNLNIIRAQLPPESAAQIADRLNDSAQLINEMTERVRDVITSLRPPVLDDYGLMAALHWYGDQFSKRTGLTTVVRGAHTLRRLPPHVETALFRIAQEALTNIVKHAQAKQVTITLDSAHNMTRLTIADDGVGFTLGEPQFAKERNGLGLGLGFVGMKERATAVNAQLRIESAPAQGTKVVVEVANSG